MNTILDEIEKKPIFTDQEIFTKIWINPGEIFRFLNENNHDKYLTILLILAGIARAFDRAVSKSMGDELSLFAIFAICIFGGGLFGWLGYYFLAALINWTGKWINGKGDFRSVLRMIVYAALPSILSMILIIPNIIINGATIFMSDVYLDSEDMLANLFAYGLLGLEIILAIFSIVFIFIGVAEAQQFSIGKAILNLLLAVGIIIVPLLLLNMVAMNFM